MNIEDKIQELEKRVKDLEIYNKKEKRNKSIKTVITIFFIIVVIILYLWIMKVIFNNYTNLF